MKRDSIRACVLSVLSLFVLGACSGAPAPVGPDEAGAAEPSVASPEQHPAPTGELPSAPKFTFVALGGPMFSEMVDKPGPALLVSLWGSGDIPPELMATVDRLFGSDREDEEEYEFPEPKLAALDAETAAGHGFAAPSETLWLVGPAGPCRARLGAPMLGWYSWGQENLELSYAVELDDSRRGCEALPDPKSKPEAWSQIAVFAESMPTDLRFVEVAPLAAGQVELATWDSPHAARVAELVAASEMGEEGQVDEVWVREVEIPGTAFVELTVAIINRHDPDPGEEPEACMDDQRNVVLFAKVDGSADGSALGAMSDRVEGWTGEMSELRGAFVHDGEVVWSVHESFGQPILIDHRVDGPGVELEIASFHPESFDNGPYSQIEYCGP